MMNDIWPDNITREIKDKESIQEIRNINRCYDKIYYYYLEGVKIKLRLRTHPEYFFEGIIKEIGTCNQDNIQKLKKDREVIKEKGYLFFIENQNKEGKDIIENDNKKEKESLIANQSKQLHYQMEDEEIGNNFILKDGDVEVMLNTYEVDASSIHPVKINPIAYFIRGNISEESRKII